MNKIKILSKESLSPGRGSKQGILYNVYRVMLGGGIKWNEKQTQKRNIPLRTRG